MMTPPKRSSAGFTLIELMIVIAIIGILAAIAIPSYQDYIRRSRASEAFQVAAKVKAAVTAYYTANDIIPTSTALAGLDATTFVAPSISSATYANGVLTVNGNNTYVGGATPVNFTLTATGQANGRVDWQCNTTSGTLYAPATCRQ